MRKLACDVGVMAYNEEKSIALALEAILTQKLKNVSIRQICVIASGCTDRTVPIVQRIAKTDHRIKLLIQKNREGKSSAVNFFLKRAKSSIVVVSGSDTIPNRDVIEKMISPFIDRSVGMTGAHPVPVDPKNTFFGFAAHFQWELHHQISLRSPKMGEMVAYRRIFKRIPYASAVDEATVEPLITGQGYTIVYVPDAIVFNKGTENIQEFMKQRRRIYAGHIALTKINGYRVSTLNKRNLIFAWLKSFKLEPRYLIYSPLVVGLEIIARLLGTYDYYFKKDRHTIWHVVPSTKAITKSNIRLASSFK